MSVSLGTSAQADVDTALRVVVTPSQSSYFAGEPLSVNITITNTRSLESLPPHRATHKRAAHSVSSAPLARPPTSPGLLRSTSIITSRPTNNGNELPGRKGLIGKQIPPKGVDDYLPDLPVNGKRKAPSKSLSVNVLPHELDEQIREETKSKLFGSIQKSDNGRALSESRLRVVLPLT